MKVCITGASGFLGSALVPDLRADGHEVLRLVRRAPQAADEARWDPTTGTVDSARLAGSDVVVHLAGQGVSDRRWSEAYKRKIVNSRVDGTTTIARACAALDRPPRVLVSASAVGWYGDTGDTRVDEAAPQGGGFLAEAVRRWEECAQPARDAGIRVVHPRTGLVLGRGGLLKPLLPLFKLGLGGKLGSGRHYMPFISLTDELRALRLLMDDDDLEGPVNLSAPEPVTNAEWTKALARAVHRPAVLTVPAPALRLALAGFADEGALVSQRVIPARLLAAGFTFTHPDVDAACRAAVA